MITLDELNDYLKELFREPEVSDYCPNGMQVQGKDRIGKIATGVTASLACIEAAVQQKADALIVHHGLFWKGDSYVISGAKRERIGLLIENGITLIGYHLPLDAHTELGNNWKAAMDLGWKDLQPFGFMNGVPIGVKGRFDPISREAFQKKIEEYYGHAATTALGGPEEVSSVGLISGGAYRSISDAANEGLDCFITGNFDEPAWHMAHEDEVNFFACGHSATERVGPMALAAAVEKKLGVETVFLDLENPF